MSFISKTIDWLKGAEKTVENAISGAEHGVAVASKAVKVDIAPIVVAITGGINTALQSGIVGSIAGVIESLLPGLGHAPEAMVDFLKKVVPEVLIGNLAMEALPENPTVDEWHVFELKVMEAFNIHTDQSKFFASFAADLIGAIQKFNADPTPKTFAQRVIQSEEIFAAFKRDVLDPIAAKKAAGTAIAVGAAVAV